MELFFDILLYVSFFVSISLFIIGVERFPKWVASIDPAKCKSNKPLEEYLGNQLLLREGKFALMFLFPVLLVFIITGFGGLCLGNYFVKTASKCEVFQKTKNYGAFIHNRGYWGMGMLICFYFSLIIFFTLWHLFYILGAI